MKEPGFPGGSAGKESAGNAGDLGSIPGLGRSPGEGKGYPLQYSGLENSMDSVVHGVTTSWTQLSDFHFLSLIGKSLWSFCPFISPPSIRDLGLEVRGGGLSIRVEKQEQRAWQGRGEANQGHSRNA